MPINNIPQEICPPGTLSLQIGGQTFCVPHPQTLMTLKDGVLNMVIDAPHGQDIAEKAAEIGIDVQGLQSEDGS